MKNSTNNNCDKCVLNPIILIPGLAGSQLYAKLNKTKSAHYYCELKTNGYFNLWLNPEEIVPLVIECFFENMRLIYDVNTKKTTNYPGVDIKIMNFGGTTDVEFLNPNVKYGPFDYFATLVSTLINDAGYERNVTLRAAPYDFRKAPNELQEYFVNVKKLFEETYEINNGKKSLIICHSLGCVVSLYFLNVFTTQSWKDKYVKSIISASAPWGGAFESLKAILTGSNFGIWLYSDKIFRNMERTFPSTYFLLPSTRVWKADDKLVITPWKNYTISDLVQVFNDANDTLSSNFYENTVNILTELNHPGVDVFCIYGLGSKTDELLYYDKKENFPEKPKKYITGNGDGTVNRISLESCLKWKDNKKYKFNSKALDKVDHLDLIKDKNFLNSIIDYLNTL